MPHSHVRLLDIPDLDDDHLALGHVIAELESCGENNGSISEVANVASRLIDVARGHFSREEEMMARDAYPLLEAHRNSHRELMKFIEAMERQLSAGQITANDELIAALWHWEAGHIDSADREYADYVQKEKPGGGTPR